MIDNEYIEVYSNFNYISRKIPYTENHTLLNVIFKYFQTLNLSFHNYKINIYDMSDVINYEYDLSKIDIILTNECLSSLKLGIYIDIKTIK